jgi:regulator of replication initiation timing
METQTQTQNMDEILDGSIVLAKQTLLTDTIQTEQKLKEFEDTYLNIVVADVKDLQGYSFIVDGMKTLKKTRTSIEKRRKELTEPALKYQRELKAEADRLTDRIENIETHLDKQKQWFENATKAEQERVFNLRIAQLTENGFELSNGFYIAGAIHLSGDKVKSLDDSEFNFYIEQGKKEKARKEAEKQLLAEQQKAMQEAQLEIQRLRDELAKERERVAKERAELEAQKQALDKTYNAPIEVVEPKQSFADLAGPPSDEVIEIQPEPIQEAEPIIETKVLITEVYEETISNESNFVIEIDGFIEFKNRLISYVSDNNNKLSRQLLIDWANEQVL